MQNAKLRLRDKRQEDGDGQPQQEQTQMNGLGIHGGRVANEKTKTLQPLYVGSAKSYRGKQAISAGPLYPKQIRHLDRRHSSLVEMTDLFQLFFSYFVYLLGIMPAG